jgi:CHAT domain-containing protein
MTSAAIQMSLLACHPPFFTGRPAVCLSTLWPVADDSTALLMAKFYELHMGDGLAPPAALRRAQVWLRPVHQH